MIGKHNFKIGILNKAKFAVIKIKSLTNTENKKRLLSNFFSLSFLQLANYILPLITLPYLVRVLGPSKYGLVAFAQAFVGYFQILTNYGFNLSATREISINRDNKEKVSEIFSSVITIQLLLAIFSFIIMLIVIFTFEKFSKDWLVYIFTFGLVVGNVLFPVWFFQGIESMKYITILDVLSRLVFTIAIFVFIKTQEDYLYLPLLNAFGSILAGIFSLWIIFNNIGVKFTLPNFASMKYHLAEGWHIFISTVAISLYTTSNTFILGLFTNNEIVGYYSGAEKIIRAIQGLYSPLSQAVYPYISKLINTDKQKGIMFIRKLTFLFGFITFTSSIITFVFAEEIVILLLGEKFIESIVVLRILAFLPFIIGLSNIFGIQTMLTLGYKKQFSNILISASIMNVFLAFVLVPLYKDIGTSIAVLISEIFVTLSMFLYLYSKRVRILEGKIV